MATSEFGKAFAAARKAGSKDFEFNGKKFTTKTAEDVAKGKKESSNAKQRERSDTIVALTKAEKEAPAGTSDLAKRKIAESKRKMLDEYATAGKAEDTKNYKPRPTPGARAPKQTTSTPAVTKPYMPEQPDMMLKKGGSVSSASKRADGIAVKGKTRGKVY